MYALGRGGSRRAINIWPGFVDGLATLLLVVMFVLMVFMVAQFFLSTALSGRDEALQKLTREITELADLLALERAANADLRINVAQLSSELQSSLAEREALSSRLSALLDEQEIVEERLVAAEQDREGLAAQIAALLEDKEATERMLAEAEKAAALSKEELAAAYETLEADRETIETQIAELAILKSLHDEMIEQLRASEAALQAEKARAEELDENLTARVSELGRLTGELDESREEIERQQALAVTLTARAQRAEEELKKERDLSKDARYKVDLLNRQIAALRQQLSKLASTLEVLEAENEQKEVRIADLGRRLNVALATKVQELARYRSEFFGKLREVLGERQDVRIAGDRFVFQSELFFETGSADLGDAGKDQLAQLAETLINVAGEFPAEIDWILRVDGHTDKRPISSYDYRSNWELSTDRALSVVRHLIDSGIPPERLAATGFGEFQPIDEGESDEALSRNRRIELRLDQR